MPWVKGQSGNPNGRPKSYDEMASLARKHTPEALATLIEIAKDKGAPPAARVAAANSLIDRGYGKPTQSHDVRVQTPAAVSTDADLLAIATASSGALAAQADGEAGSDGMVH